MDHPSVVARKTEKGVFQMSYTNDRLNRRMQMTSRYIGRWSILSTPFAGVGGQHGEKRGAVHRRRTSEQVAVKVPRAWHPVRNPSAKTVEKSEKREQCSVL